MYFARHGLAIELDLLDTHGGPHAYARDRRKDGELLARGISTLRVTGEELEERPAAAVRRIAEALAARRAG